MQRHKTLGPSSASVWLALIKMGPLLVLIALVATLSVTAPKFMQWPNLQNLMQQATPIALLALGQLFVVLTRGVDLSIGSTVSLTSVVGALFGLHVSGSPLLVIAVMLVTGASVGAVNAFVIVRLGVNNPFIVTLAMLGVVKGAAILVAGGGGSIAGIPPFIQDLAVGRTAGMPTAFLCTLGIAALAAIFLHRTLWGRWIYAIGGNPSAADRVGIPAGAVVASCYILAGVSAGLASLCISGRFGSGFPEAGGGMELDTVSAVVIGGASFLGGRGGVSAALVGALIIATVANGLNVAGVEPTWQLVAVGLILIGALAVDQLRARVEERARAAKGRQAEGESAPETRDLLSEVA